MFIVRTLSEVINFFLLYFRKGTKMRTMRTFLARFIGLSIVIGVAWAAWEWFTPLVSWSVNTLFSQSEACATYAHQQGYCSGNDLGGLALSLVGAAVVFAIPGIVGLSMLFHESPAQREDKVMAIAQRLASRCREGHAVSIGEDVGSAYFFEAKELFEKWLQSRNQFAQWDFSQGTVAIFTRYNLRHG